MTTTSTLEGRVESTNERGLKLHGEWFSVSKFKPVELPQVGATVRVAVDPKGFLSSVQVLEAPTPAVSRNATMAEPGRAITRLAVLKAAAYFCGQRATVVEGVKSSDVLKIADAWLAWVDQADTHEVF